MEKSKIEIKIGIVEFVGEGDQEWLSQQLDKVLNKVPELLKIEFPNSDNAPSQQTTEIPEAQVSNNPVPTDSVPRNLVTYLREKNATGNQVNKFLVTAVFLQLNGKSRITTSEISESLRTSNQSKLANASDALNKNVRKGF